MKKVKDTSVKLQQVREVLYIGTNEQTAKLAPLKGLDPPIYLTDVYPGFFCKQTCKSNERWGIISVNLKQLHTEMFAPSPAYLAKYARIKNATNKLSNHKNKWQKSLDSCGVCVYTSRIPPSAIQKIMIYSPTGRDSNIAINNLINELPTPELISPSEHKALYSKSLGILRWLNGEPVRCEDIFNGQTNIKIINEIEDKLNQRFGLDMYYIKPEERGRKGVKLED